MVVGSVSTFTLREVTRSATSQIQARLSEAASEVSSGRYFDVGRVLGRQAAQTIDARQSIVDLDAILETNGLVSTRMATVQGSLSSMADIANDFFETLTSGAHAGADRSLIVEDARAKLSTLVSLLSATHQGAYVFGGTNSAVQPVADYLADPPAAGRTAVLNSFAMEFGFPPSDPQTVAISPAQMQSYLDGAYGALFQPPNWESAFSSAANGGIELRISTREVVTLEASGNDQGIRRLFETLAATIDCGLSNLNGETFQSFARSMAERASTAASELMRSQAVVGSVQERVVKASERMEVQRGLLHRMVGQLENVDLATASARLNHLATQLDVSYAVTARIQNLSLLNYLR